MLDGMLSTPVCTSARLSVIGVTSSREKADRLEAFGGYDAVIAYKTEDLDQRLAELAPDGIDVFIDNVGAEQLDAGLRHMKVSGKILSVGVIAETRINRAGRSRSRARSSRAGSILAA